MRFSLAPILVVFLFVLASCSEQIAEIPTPEKNMTATPILPNGSIGPARNSTYNGSNEANVTGGSPPIPDPWLETHDDSCTQDSECVLVRASYCGGARGVNERNLEDWNEYLAKEDAEGKANREMCGISLPLSYFEARCIEEMCTAVQKRPFTEDNLACETDADCAVKNVGNCCGEYLQCVNKDYEPDLAALQTKCEKQGPTSFCGGDAEEIDSCECMNSRCKTIY